MATSYIGIRVADGTYYPVFESGFRGRKRMVLTTVRDNQSTVQIDLYRGAGTEMADPEYVGTLLVEHVEQASKGEPEISLLVGLDQNGNLNATASDTKTGEYQSLSVSLSELSEEDTYEVPDFELEEGSVGDVDTLDETESAFADAEAISDSEAEAEPFAEPEEVSPFDEQLGDFEQISFGDEDDSEESSGHSYDEEAAGIRGVEPGSAESLADETEQFSQEDEVEELGFDEGAFDEESGAEHAGAEAAAAEEPAAQDEAPFEDGRIPEKYRPESKTNPFILVSFIVLALAACGIIAYVVFTALQPGAGGTEGAFIVLAAHAPLRRRRVASRRSLLYRVLRR